MTVRAQQREINQGRWAWSAGLWSIRCYHVFRPSGFRPAARLTGVATIPLAPVRDRVMRPGRRGRECWGVTTADVVWDIERQDAPGTPWSIGHNPTRAVVAEWPTLRACTRRGVS